MANILTVSIQKGGVGKSTISAITSYLLAEKGKKVLAIDFDSQGNLTKIFTQRSIYENNDRTIYEGIKEGDVSPYILKINENIDLLPANDYLALLERWLYTEYVGQWVKALEHTLDPIKENYDWIIIDTPPSLGGLTTNALAASDFVVIPWLTDELTDDALPPFYETVEFVQKNVNPKLKVAGILARIVDGRLSDTQEYLDKLERDYPNIRFRQLIKRNAEAGRIPKYGFFENKKIKKALEDYQGYIEELMERVRT